MTNKQKHADAKAYLVAQCRMFQQLKLLPSGKNATERTAHMINRQQRQIIDEVVAKTHYTQTELWGFYTVLFQKDELKHYQKATADKIIKAYEKYLRREFQINTSTLKRDFKAKTYTKHQNALNIPNSYRVIYDRALEAGAMVLNNKDEPISYKTFVNRLGYKGDALETLEKQDECRILLEQFKDGADGKPMPNIKLIVQQGAKIQKNTNDIETLKGEIDTLKDENDKLKQELQSIRDENVKLKELVMSFSKN